MNDKRPIRKKTSTIRKHDNTNIRKDSDRSLKKKTVKRDRTITETIRRRRSLSSDSLTPENTTTTDEEDEGEEPPYIENLFLKVKEDREKAGMALFPEKRSNSTKSKRDSKAGNIHDARIRPDKANGGQNDNARNIRDAGDRPDKANIDQHANTGNSKDPNFRPGSANIDQHAKTRNSKDPNFRPDKANVEQNSNTPIFHGTGNRPNKANIKQNENAYNMYDDERLGLDNPSIFDINDEELALDKYPSDHRPAPTPSISSEQPTTPSSLNLSDWDEDLSDVADVDTEGEEEFRDDKWPNDKTLAQCNMYMMKHDIDCDVTILVGQNNDVHRAHSFILKHRSPEFKELLNTAHCEDGTTNLVLNETRNEVFEQIIRYIYSDKADLTTELAWEIIPTTAFTGPRALRGKCLRFLLGNEMNSDNACRILEYAHESGHSKEYRKCLRFIHVNAIDVLETDNFTDLCRNCVDDITKSDDLNADEYTVFDALVRWSDKECDREEIEPTDTNRREVLEMLIFNVRYATLDADEFSERISEREILTAEETMEIFQVFHRKTDDLPDHFVLYPRREYDVKYHLRQEPPMFSRASSTPINSPGNNEKQVSSRSQSGKRTSKSKKKVIADADRPCTRVVRFQKFGDDWEMEGADCITFRVTSPIVFRGVQIFAPEDPLDAYSVDVKLYDDMQNEIRADKVLIEPEGGQPVHDVILEQPARIPADRFFTIQLIIRSGRTPGGGDGVRVIDSGGVIFEFRNGDNSSSRTDVTKGQIPSIIYSKLEQ